MKRKIFILIGLFLVVLFQTAFIPIFFFSGSSPNLALILIVFLSSKMRLRQLWWYIIIAGVLFDIFLFFPLGTHSVLFLLLSLGVKIFERKLFIIHTTWKFFVLAVLVALCSVAYEIMLPAILHLAKHDFLIEYRFNKFLVYNIISFAVLYSLLLRIEEFFKSYHQGTQIKNHVG